MPLLKHFLTIDAIEADVAFAIGTAGLLALSLLQIEGVALVLVFENNV